MHGDITRIILKPDIEDYFIFTLTDSGEFSSKAYWELIREKGVNRRWTSRIWRHFIPYKTCAFMWRLLHHALPVDQRVRTKGIPIVSRCSCCKLHKEETLQHLFLQSECAAKVWEFFGKCFGVSHVPNSIYRTIMVWSPKVVNDDQFTAVRTSVSSRLMRYGKLGAVPFSRERV